MGRGSGEFEPATYFGADPANSFPIRLADLDADGKAELVMILQRRRSINILQRGTTRQHDSAG